MFLSVPLKSLISSFKENGLKIVLVTGVFDVLHHEHQNFLLAAKKLGDLLIVGIESDKRVSELKGPKRPVNNAQCRMNNLKKWGIADEMFILPENMGEKAVQVKVIGEIQPDYLAVSSHTPFLQEKQKIVEKFGGQLKVVHKQNPEVSTTIILSQS